jgi:hypothetical protein
LINAPDRVLVWQSQLAANDFPPVCAMTGAPAETWRKFSFATAPPWAFWVGGLLVAALMSRRASGYLPLTRASVQRLRLFTWSFFGIIPLAVIFFVASFFASSVNNPVWSAVTFLLFVLGVSSIIVFLIGILLARRLFGPTGKVLEPQPGHYESLIELRNVHPNFVTAVQQLQYARAQSAYSAPSPLQPNWK